ncbi:MAG: hypothetical protein IE928_01925 [Gammaproteobacteria bacterium]|nr:hypothetical protein [Gammaproteobacteria bacterium]
MPSAVSHETLVRQLQVLQFIPRSPAQITVADLRCSLSELGFSALVVQFSGLERYCNRDAKAHLPMMSLREAITLHLVSKPFIACFATKYVRGLISSVYSG